MELSDSTNPLSAWRKESSSKVKGILLLAEAGARYNTHTSSIEESESVKLIWGSALLLGLSNGLLAEGDGWEEVHGAVWFLANDALHLFEGLVESVGACSETGGDSVVFLLVEFVGRRTFGWWVDHQLDQALADNRRAERDGDILIDLLLDFLFKATELEVATTVTTLTYHPLRDGVEGCKLNVLVLFWFALLHPAEGTLE